MIRLVSLQSLLNLDFLKGFKAWVKSVFGVLLFKTFIAFFPAFTLFFAFFLLIGFCYLIIITIIVNWYNK